MATYAYIRVSTKEQNTGRQIMAMEPYDIPKQNIYIDYQSGRDFQRTGYRKLIRKLKEGDLLVVKSIDRLGRNYDDILTQWRKITKEIKADICVLDMDLLDTRVKNGDLTGKLIADLVLQILAYVAQTEREFIHQRQAEGIAAAKARGKRFGRQATAMPPEFEDMCRQCFINGLATRQAAQELGVSHTTFYRNYKKYQKKVSDSRLSGTNTSAYMMG